jgi:hypothetical protein
MMASKENLDFSEAWCTNFTYMMVENEAESVELDVLGARPTSL